MFLAGHEAAPGAWLRGVPAASQTTPVFCEALAERAKVLYGSVDALEKVRRDDGYVVIYGDGSGGRHFDDPRRRRCAFLRPRGGPEAIQPMSKLPTHSSPHFSHLSQQLQALFAQEQALSHPPFRRLWGAPRWRRE